MSLPTAAFLTSSSSARGLLLLLKPDEVGVAEVESEALVDGVDERGRVFLRRRVLLALGGTQPGKGSSVPSVGPRSTWSAVIS